MAKIPCDVCGKDMGWLDKVKLYDGAVCNDCLEKAKLKPGIADKCFSVEQVKKTIAGEIEPTEIVQCIFGRWRVFFNHASGLWMTNENLYSKSHTHRLENVVSYDYYENDKKYSVVHTAGTAAVGGLVFGGAGAMVGAIIGNNQKRKISEAYIIVKQELGGTICMSGPDGEIYQQELEKREYSTKITLLGKANLLDKGDAPIKEGSKAYSNLLQVVKDIGSEFDKAIAKREPELKSNSEINTSATGTASSDSTKQCQGTKAQEIMQMKELLDQGIITEEEFEKEKKKILDREY